MKSISILPAFIVLCATSALADNCTPGLNYCGSTLVQVGNYQAQIDQALSDAGVANINGGKADLFNCIGGSNGVIRFLQSCNGCINAGRGNSDFCD